MGRNADAVVANADVDRGGSTHHGQRDVPAVGRVLRSIVEQVADDLREAHGIDATWEALGRHRDEQRLAARLDPRLRGDDRIGDDRLDVEHLQAELQLVPRDPRQVAEVVDDPRQYPALTRDDVDGALAGRVLWWRRASDNTGGGGDGGERISQLVNQRREDLVAAPALRDGRARALPLLPTGRRDVGEHAEHPLVLRAEMSIRAVRHDPRRAERLSSGGKRHQHRFYDGRLARQLRICARREDDSPAPAVVDTQRRWAHRSRGAT